MYRTLAGRLLAALLIHAAARSLVTFPYQDVSDAWPWHAGIMLMIFASPLLASLLLRNRVCSEQY